MKAVPGEGRSTPGLRAHHAESAHSLDAMRSWLVSGVQYVDPRRRFGGHGRTRGLLVVGRQAVAGASERWHKLAAALDRHTVRSALSELSPDERHLITLAYLEGSTNREIADFLGVSVTTVRRRLWVALDRLEAQLSRTGAWLSAFMLAVVAYAASHAMRLGRSVSTGAISMDKAQRLAATLAAGAVTAAVLGVVAVTSDSAVPGKSPHTGTKGLPPVAAAAQPSNPRGSVTVPPSSAQPDGVALATSGSTGVAPTGGRKHNKGCQGNPTSAPPPVPVGSHDSHPPVTHPGAGGCKDIDPAP